MSANSHNQEAVMTSRSPLPWVLSWDANGELANHDRYDLLQADALSTRPARFSSALRRWEAASGLHRASFTGRPQPVAGFDPLAQAVAGERPHALGAAFPLEQRLC